MNPTLQKILEEFDEKFPKCTQPICGDDEDCWEDAPRRSELKDFIISAITSYRKELVGQIEGMKKKVRPLEYKEGLSGQDYQILYHEQTLRIGYNQALSDILSKLEET